MANRFIGGILSSQQAKSGGFVSRASTGTYFNNQGQLVTAPPYQPRLNYSFNGNPISTRYSLFANSTGYLSTTSASAFAFGANNFTIEYWSYQFAVSDERRTIYSYSSNQQFIVGHSSNTVFFAAYTSSNSLIGQPTTAAGTLVANQWNHIAVVRNGSTVTIYINGVSQATASFSTTAIRTDQTTLYVGNDPVTSGRTFNGYLSNVRIVNGVAVYTGNFTVPSAPLTATQSSGTNISAITGTSTTLLTCQNNGFTDFSPAPLTITNNGGVASTFLPPIYPSDFSGTGWYNPTILLEPASTNLNTYSSTLTGWSLNGVTSISTNNIAPDGSSTAIAFSDGTTSSYKDIELNFTLTPTTYTFSAFVKSSIPYFILAVNFNGNTPYANVVFNMLTGTIYTTSTSSTASPYSSAPWGNITNVGNGWYRLSMSFTVLTQINGAVNTHRIGPSIDGTNTQYGGSSYQGASRLFYVWGVQIEQTFGATSYIPTNGTAVTRAQDDVGAGASGLYNLNQIQPQTAIDDQSTIQTFTATGTSTWTAPPDVTSVEVLVVAGGGGANNSNGGNSTGGGGGGGVVYNTSYPVTPGVTYPVVVGAGGAPAASNSVNPSNGGSSQFGNLIAIGGGFGAGRDPNTTGGSGGSGGGGNTYGTSGGQGIAGQGYPGGTGVNYSAGVSGAGGGGGGAAGAGGNGVGQLGGLNGPGVGLTISGSLIYYGAGGVGQSTGGSLPTPVAGGTATNTNGAANTGAGGAGGTTNNGTSTGGSGIVVIKYKRTNTKLAAVSNAAVITQKFISNNIWVAPVGVTGIEALVVAGGGSGSDATTGGGGGAGGLVYSTNLSVTPGSAYTVIVGSGGAVVTNNVGNAGGNSYLGYGTQIIPNSTFSTPDSTYWGASLVQCSLANNQLTFTVGSSSRATNSSLPVTTGSYLLALQVYSNPQAYTIIIDDDGLGAGLGSVTTYLSTTITTGIAYATVSKTASPRARIMVTSTITGSNTVVVSAISMTAISSSLVAIGGGTGGAYGSPTGGSGGSGGSGGGGGFSQTSGSGAGGSSTQNSSGSTGFGNAGGAGAPGGSQNGSGGGGGAGSVGGTATGTVGGVGGSGLPFSITGNLEYYAGGGGGGSESYTGVLPASGGIGGGGYGSIRTSVSAGINATAGAPNTGGGGGGSSNYAHPSAGAGGSGVVVIRYRVPYVATFQDSGSWTCPAGVTTVQALIVAGGGSGSIGGGGGGGGAGGLVYSSSISVTPGTTYPIVVGAGGVGVTGGPDINGTAGQNSSFNGLVAIGGGQGAHNGYAGQTGGSGGGAYGSGNAGSGTYGQGNSGGGGVTDSSTYTNGGGGGGAGGAGGAAIATQGGAGGTGLPFSISGTLTYYAGGGAGGVQKSGGSSQVGGLGGGGNNSGAPNSNGLPGTQNTGGGGGGASYTNASVASGSGGSGIVIIRYYGG